MRDAISPASEAARGLPSLSRPIYIVERTRSSFDRFGLTEEFATTAQIPPRKTRVAQKRLAKASVPRVGRTIDVCTLLKKDQAIEA